MACLRSFSRRNLSPKWFCKTSSPLVLHRIKDYTESTLPDSSLLIRRFHRQSFFEDKAKMSFAQPVGSGVSLCRHLSSSSSCKPEESCIKTDAFGNVVEELVPEKSLEAMATTVPTTDEFSAAIENLSFPEDCVQQVINGIHELTGFNWWMSIVLTAFLVNGLMSPISLRIQRQAWEIQHLGRSIQKVKRLILICDPKFLAKYKKWEAEWTGKVGKRCLSFLTLSFVHVFITTSFINGISAMAKKIPGFENGGIFWFTDLSTPDRFYILPLVTGFTFWLTSEVREVI
ncbi:unnamed protein product [Thlaspi arvense]|uniref:Uncharacterized protein n=1 Tax=Thlaspi arvense TaxID=13288 RepID=A0AAU9S5F7_THLAR|nr:unnamed protein product [Thlaspi arvense]